MYLKKGLLWGHNIEFKDKNADLEGHPLRNNPVLIKKLKKNWEAGLKSIRIKELLELGIFIPPFDMKISDNIYIVFDEYKLGFGIELCNDNRDIDNKWEDKVVDVEKVKTTLSKYDYNKPRLKLAEVPLNKDLKEYLEDFFVSVKKSSTSKEGNLDLLIGNGKNAVAIELKLSREIKDAGKSQKA
jgi:hypothetical protein